MNDGSTDNSLCIAEKFSKNEPRIKVVSQSNGGLNSARNFGLKFVSHQSDAFLFFDADDILHGNAIEKMYKLLEENDELGAVYCDYEPIDSNGNVLKYESPYWRFEPTLFWAKNLGKREGETSFYSIYAWAPVIEPMTLIRRKCFEKYGPWDEANFPKGKTFGESIPLIGMIALEKKIFFLSEKLYSYRRHQDQITGQKRDYKSIQRKIDHLMKARAEIYPSFRSEINYAIGFVKLRLPLIRYLQGSLKHQFRHRPILAIITLIKYTFLYLQSLFFYKAYT